MNSKQRAQVLALFLVLTCFAALAWRNTTGHAQLPDKTVTPNTADVGINKSFAEQAGTGRGDVMSPGSSSFIISRDPFRSIRRGRQLFQRKYTKLQGVGPLTGDGAGNIETTLAIGAGLADSCAACHGRPRGAAGFGGDVVTRPDSRDAPHLFGLGLKPAPFIYKASAKPKGQTPGYRRVTSNAATWQRVAAPTFAPRRRQSSI